EATPQATRRGTLGLALGGLAAGGVVLLALRLSALANRVEALETRLVQASTAATSGSRDPNRPDASSGSTAASGAAHEPGSKVEAQRGDPSPRRASSPAAALQSRWYEA